YTHIERFYFRIVVRYRLYHHAYTFLYFFIYFFFFLMIRRPPRSTLFSLHDALPISRTGCARSASPRPPARRWTRCSRRRTRPSRSEEHTSELQSRSDLVCRLLLEKKKKKTSQNKQYITIKLQQTTLLKDIELSSSIQ